MYQAPEQLMHLSKSNIEAALSLANITLQSAERLVDLNLKTAKEALDQSLRSAKAFSEAKNVQEIVNLQSTSAQPSLEKAMAYSRCLYEVAAETQSRISKVLEGRLAELNGNLMTAVDEAIKSAPAGSENAFTAFKSAVAAANSAYETLARATQPTAANTVPQAAKSAKKKTH